MWKSGGYLFLLLMILNTRLMSAIITLQKRNRVSQVMYIASPPSFVRKAKKI